MDQELRKIVHKLHGSNLEREALSGQPSSDFEQALAEVKMLLSQKSNKADQDHEMVTRQIKTMQGYITQLIYL